MGEDTGDLLPIGCLESAQGLNYFCFRLTSSGEGLGFAGFFPACRDPAVIRRVGRTVQNMCLARGPISNVNVVCSFAPGELPVSIVRKLKDRTNALLNAFGLAQRQFFDFVFCSHLAQKIGGKQFCCSGLL